MVQKIQALQKRLIAKTEEVTTNTPFQPRPLPSPWRHDLTYEPSWYTQVVEKDLLIQEKDKLYVEIKNILARQPGPEVAEQLSIYQQGLRDKTKSMNAMASEPNMYQAQVSEFK